MRKSVKIWQRIGREVMNAKMFLLAAFTAALLTA
tara:strand:- start:4629 stop:4730 length:102 start_codon:yes stop_codon:yes gene_type:complete